MKKTISIWRGFSGLARGAIRRLEWGSFVVVVLLFAETGFLTGNESDWRNEARKLIDSFEVITAGRSTLYERLETPELKPEAMPVPPPPAPTQAAPKVSELEEMRRWESMDFVTLFLCCTVYDGQWTEVRFWHDQVEVVFWSTIDFQLFTPIIEFETSSACYSMFLATGSSTRPEFEEVHAGYGRIGGRDLVTPWPVELLRAASLSGRDEWRLVSPKRVSAFARRTIKELHSYYRKNSREIARRHAELEAEKRTQEELARINPLKPRNTLVEYFPIRSSTKIRPASAGQEGLK